MGTSPKIHNTVVKSARVVRSKQVPLASVAPSPSSRLPPRDTPYLEKHADVLPVATEEPMESPSEEQVELSPSPEYSGEAEETPELDMPTLPNPPRTPDEEEKTPPESSEGVCFPGNATVMLEGGVRREMRHLQIGDRVLVGAGVFSTVFMFTHRTEQVKNTFVTITVMDDGGVMSVVSLTPSHFIYCNSRLVEAKNVRRGDVLYLGDGEKAIVVAVGWSFLDGLYNPQTLVGDIVVNGVWASTYTKAIPVAVGHSLLCPLRWAFRAGGWYTTVFERGLAGLMFWK